MIFFGFLPRMRGGGTEGGVDMPTENSTVPDVMLGVVVGVLLVNLACRGRDVEEARIEEEEQVTRHAFSYPAVVVVR